MFTINSVLKLARREEVVQRVEDTVAARVLEGAMEVEEKEVLEMVMDMVREGREEAGEEVEEVEVGVVGELMDMAPAAV